jgi:hypothetical protein
VQPDGVRKVNVSYRTCNKGAPPNKVKLSTAHIGCSPRPMEAKPPGLARRQASRKVRLPEGRILADRLPVLVQVEREATSRGFERFGDGVPGTDAANASERSVAASR